MKGIFLWFIRGYQRYISPKFPRRCKYQPTCSQYALDSIAVHGVIKGTLLGMWRLLRCNPWSKGGVDWVPEPGTWPSKPLGYTELMEFRENQELREHQESSGQRGHGDDLPMATAPERKKNCG